MLKFNIIYQVIIYKETNYFNILHLYVILALKLTIISSSTAKQEECKKALNNYVQERSFVLPLLGQSAPKMDTTSY